ncbi:MAG: methionine adenosyltransferase [Chloroflexi bacterium]|nr:methionine adenosyltransferase [Chloroflexota bacterium]|tara:strand:- start:587 stop:1789 length:1203 start_codon:yes stop_codon:yes gene_type:complete
MVSTFNDSSSFLFTSESVTEGHPDKVCDQISDAILDSVLAQDPNARVACETCVTTGLVIIMGEMTTKIYVDIPDIVRSTLKNIGYTNAEFGIDYNTCGVMVSVKEQSPEISSAVSKSLEARQSEHENTNELIGAGDQGMMVGYACNETPELMPLPISLAHKLTRKLAEVRKNSTLKYLRPDGKSQVTVEYQKGKPKRIHTIILSAQHNPEITSDQLENELRSFVIDPIIPKSLIDETTVIKINPSGLFVLGGPNADTGLTGRKILVDTYGGSARHGGGAFSGKDPTKVDRSGAYAARHVAKNLVAAGIAERAEVQISYAIGMAIPISVSVETFGTSNLSDDKISDIVNTYFDLRPQAIIDNMKLRNPIYGPTASYGHFGREDLDLPWESTDIAKLIQDHL